VFVVALCEKNPFVDRRSAKEAVLEKSETKTQTKENVRIREF